MWPLSTVIYRLTIVPRFHPAAKIIRSTSEQITIQNTYSIRHSCSQLTKKKTQPTNDHACVKIFCSAIARESMNNYYITKIRRSLSFERKDNNFIRCEEVWRWSRRLKFNFPPLLALVSPRRQCVIWFWPFFLLSFADRLAVIVFGIITLIAGVILSSVPWLNYFILKVNFSISSLQILNFTFLHAFHAFLIF